MSNIKKEIAKAIRERYGDLETLRQAMYECEDTAIVNLSQDTDNKFTDEDILVCIYNNKKN